MPEKADCVAPAFLGRRVRRLHLCNEVVVFENAAGFHLKPKIGKEGNVP